MTFRRFIDFLNLWWALVNHHVNSFAPIGQLPSALHSMPGVVGPNIPFADPYGSSQRELAVVCIVPPSCALGSGQYASVVSSSCKMLFTCAMDFTLSCSYHAYACHRWSLKRKNQMAVMLFPMAVDSFRSPRILSTCVPMNVGTSSQSCITIWMSETDRSVAIALVVASKHPKSPNNIHLFTDNVSSIVSLDSSWLVVHWISSYQIDI